MEKVIGLFLCVVCIFTFSAYDWGRKSKPKKETQETQPTYAVAKTVKAPATPVVSQKNTQKTYKRTEKAVPTVTKPVVQEELSNKQVTPSPVKEVTPPADKAVVATTPANDKAIAIVTLAKIVGSGTPEERKARIESLKRLSQALAKSQGQQP